MRVEENKQMEKNSHFLELIGTEPNWSPHLKKNSKIENSFEILEKWFGAKNVNKKA